MKLSREKVERYVEIGREEGSDEVDIYAGTLDEPERFVPTYQLWTVRRLPWLVAIDRMTDYSHNREDAAA